MGRWQYRSCAAHVSELAQTLPESGTSRVERIENLQWRERGTKKRDTEMDLVQMIDKRYQIIALNGWPPSLILLPVEYGTDLIVKRGGIPVETTESF